MTFFQGEEKGKAGENCVFLFLLRKHWLQFNFMLFVKCFFFLDWKTPIGTRQRYHWLFIIFNELVLGYLLIWPTDHQKAPKTEVASQNGWTIFMCAHLQSRYTEDYIYFLENIKNLTTFCTNLKTCNNVSQDHVIWM